MDNPADAALDALKRVVAEFAEFCSRRGSVSEADTRVKVIDRVLREVCGWPEAALSREDHVERGYIDYSFSLQERPYVAVEAKREGIPFVFPVGVTTKTLKLSGTLLTEAAIRDAIRQVRGYCDDGGIRYAIATNGYAWIVFRAIREDVPWRDGTARIFPSLEYIVDHFTEFWNLLSFPALAAGALDAEFGSPRRATRQLHRVIGNLFNADLPLQRNRLHAQLDPLIRAVFEDIADQDELEILQSCYVHSASLRIVASDMNLVITDSIPKFLRDQGAEPVRQSAVDAGRFGGAMSSAIASNKGQLFLLLGGIGSGKTTFLKRYQRTVGRDLLEKHAVWFHVDFLGAPLDPLELEPFVWRTVLEQLRSRYSSPHLETRRNIKRAFADDIAALNETALRHLRGGSDEYEKGLSRYLERWQSDVSSYVPRLLRLCKPRQDLCVILFIDNVDQLSSAYQAQIFLLAQRVTRMLGSVTIVALREESYYTANVQRTFTAYTNRKFHIASPRFSRLIGSRIKYAIKVLETSEAQPALPFTLSAGITLDKDAISEFLRIVEFSIFEKNRNIARFIEALCFGNMRLALQMFTTFLVSGATDVPKMLHIYRRDGAYFVPMHEFLKSVMLGDRRYYKETESPIANVFDCGGERNSSHFTGLRCLAFLLSYRGQSSSEGQGYLPISEIVRLFEDVFDNREDLIRTMDRLVARQLIEANTRSTESSRGASHVRVTSSGWYYLRHLVQSFSYLDLVLQDTPLNDPATERGLRESVFRVDNLGDREEDKLARMEARFDRVQRFLDYLRGEEDVERKRFNLARISSTVAEPIMPKFLAEFAREKEWIGRRLRENREKYAEDVTPTVLAEEGVPGPAEEEETDGEEDGSPA